MGTCIFCNLSTDQKLVQCTEKDLHTLRKVSEQRQDGRTFNKDTKFHESCRKKYIAKKNVEAAVSGKSYVSKKNVNDLVSKIDLYAHIYSNNKTLIFLDRLLTLEILWFKFR